MHGFPLGFYEINYTPQKRFFPLYAGNLTYRPITDSLTQSSIFSAVRITYFYWYLLSDQIVHNRYPFFSPVIYLCMRIHNLLYICSVSFLSPPLESAFLTYR